MPADKEGDFTMTTHAVHRPLRRWSEEPIITPEPWVADALCAQTDPEVFFPEKGGSTREAKAVCKRCDVVVECLTYALRTGQTEGVWGGRSARELMKLRWGSAACSAQSSTSMPRPALAT